MGKMNAALYEQCEEILIKLALEELALEEAEAAAAELEESESDIPEETLHRLYIKGHQRLRAGIKLEERKNRRRHFVTRTLPRAARIAAAVICVFYLGLTVAYAAIPVVRHQLFKLLVRFEETHAEVSMDSYASFEVPADWRGTHFPARIPNDFSVYAIECDASENYVEYRDQDNLHYIRLSISGPDTVTNINSEDSAISYQFIRGFDVMFASRPDLITAVWQDSDQYFVASSDILDKVAMEGFITGIVKIK